MRSRHDSFLCRRRLAAAEPDLPPHRPDIENEHVRADEEQDERLDHQRQVAGELRREDGLVEPPRRGAVDESTEEERSKADADSGVAAEKRDGDADEADVRDLDVENADVELPAEDV